MTKQELQELKEEKQMDIPEAIEILKLLIQNARIQNQLVDIPALQLGIEALKHFKYAREHNAVAFKFLLPGETREEKNAKAMP